MAPTQAIFSEYMFSLEIRLEWKPFGLFLHKLEQRLGHVPKLFRSSKSQTPDGWSSGSSEELTESGQYKGMFPSVQTRQAVI